MDNIKHDMELAITQGDIRKVDRLITEGQLQGRICPRTCNYLDTENQKITLFYQAVLLSSHLPDCWSIPQLIIERGADVNNKEERSGATALQYCRRLEQQEKLLQYGASPLLPSSVINNNALLAAIHKIYFFDYAPSAVQHLVEFEYNQALRGEAFDPTIILPLLKHQNSREETPCELSQWFVKKSNHHWEFSKLVEGADYLKNWEDPSAVQTHQKTTDNIVAEGVKINPLLSEFQSLPVMSILEILSRMPIEQTRYIILGYLAPIDLVNGWGTLMKEKRSC